MRKRPLRTALVVLAVAGGLLGAAFGLLRLAGLGPFVVVLRNAGTERTERVSILQVGDVSRDVLAESDPVRLGPGETTEVSLERKADALVQVRIPDATGTTRRFTIDEYVMPAFARTLWIEIVDGQVTRVRVQRGGDDAYSDVRWTAESGWGGTRPR